ncbi:hypothetical protein Ancab_013045 [Ancistrocladus abbreviatus]
MVQLLSFLEDLVRNISFMKPTNSKNDMKREAAETFVKLRKNSLMSKSSGGAHMRPNDIAAKFSKNGRKGINQDFLTVWQEFGCQEDMIFCGVFDGHGPWGHFVAKRVSKLLPSSLLCHWQETVALCSLELNSQMGFDRDAQECNIWKQSYVKTCDTVDKELENNPGVDSFYSGTTALTIVRQGKLIVIANVGDSRAVLATTDDNDNLMAVQLTTDLKPCLPQEVERITQSKGQVFCLHDEPGAYRVWRPCRRGPGLAVSRAFGDHCMKNFGVISVPEVTHRYITTNDLFVILATDGVWDVVSNEEAVQIVFSATERRNSAKTLVNYAASAWKYKRPGIPMDDISAICLYFHPCPSCQPSGFIKQ